MTRILAIIPARGGSKGIKNKNIVKVNKKPLICYTIKSALQAKYAGLLDEVIVSTDSREIAKVSKKNGAEVPFLRPKKISGDRAKTVDVIRHAIYYYEELGVHYDCVVLLQPTSPMRKYEDIKHAIDQFVHQTKYKSLISVYCADGISSSILYTTNNGIAIPILPKLHSAGIRRQEAKQIYVRNGAIYITDVEYLKQQNAIISEQPLLYEMPYKRSLNIDTTDDLKIFRSLYARKRHLR